MTFPAWFEGFCFWLLTPAGVVSVSAFTVALYVWLAYKLMREFRRKP